MLVSLFFASRRRHTRSLRDWSSDVCSSDLAVIGGGARRGKPLCILDLGVPRDVDPAIAQIENVFLYDIDDLQTVAAQATARRRDEVPAAERIVEEETDRFW